MRRLIACLALVCAVSTASAQNNAPDTFVRDRYTKAEAYVPTRDGTQLYVSIYVPKDASAAKTYPIMLTRTPYNCAPYGPDPDTRVGPSRVMEEEGYIFVCNDVRGRWMSDGAYATMTPHVPFADGPSESRDAYDVIDWLLRNVQHNNGRVGNWGISYPGFYTSAALPEQHPALVASSPQAPIADFWFDDFHHRGAYLLSYLLATNLFGIQKDGRTAQPWYQIANTGTRDGYRWMLENNMPQNADRLMGQDNYFWQELKNHPNYDNFWKARNLLPHLKDVRAAVLTVGGLFDAEDLYGAWNTYKAIERQSPNARFNGVVMGPWSHGQWSSPAVTQRVGTMLWGDSLSLKYQRDVEAPFFRRYLKGNEGTPAPAEATIYDTGLRRWERFARWPVPEGRMARFYLRADGKVATTAPTTREVRYSEYVSDPAKPVPDMQEMWSGITPRDYMDSDQRFASRRPDVLVFQTDSLESDVTLAGDVMAHLRLTSSGTDSDFIVKLIDVFPANTPNDPKNPGVVLGGYEMLVRSEIQPARFRTSFERPLALVPGQLTTVDVPLQGILHTFKRGHRIMVHVQSTMYPLFQRNPQTFVPNIMMARPNQFQKATQRIYHSAANASWFEVLRLN